MKTWIVLGMVGALAACSDSKKLSAGWVGTYDCSESAALTFTTPSDMPPTTTSASATWTIASPSDGVLTAVVVSEGDAVACLLQFANNGGAATIADGQSCAANGLALAYDGGTLHYVVYSMSANLPFAFDGTMTVAGDAGPGQTVHVTGTGTATTTCTERK